LGDDYISSKNDFEIFRAIQFKRNKSTKARNFNYQYKKSKVTKYQEKSNFVQVGK